VNRRATARFVRWTLVIALYASGVIFAANIGEPPAEAGRAEPVAVNATIPARAPEAPLVTLALAGAVTVGYGVWRLAHLPRRRRPIRVARPSATAGSAGTAGAAAAPR
jgi:hypothetical protein